MLGDVMATRIPTWAAEGVPRTTMRRGGVAATCAARRRRSTPFRGTHGPRTALVAKGSDRTDEHDHATSEGITGARTHVDTERLMMLMCANHPVLTMLTATAIMRGFGVSRVACMREGRGRLRVVLIVVP